MYVAGERLLSVLVEADGMSLGQGQYLARLGRDGYLLTDVVLILKYKGALVSERLRRSIVGQHGAEGVDGISYLLAVETAVDGLCSIFTHIFLYFLDSKVRACYEVLAYKFPVAGEMENHLAAVALIVYKLCLADGVERYLSLAAVAADSCYAEVFLVALLLE